MTEHEVIALARTIVEKSDPPIEPQTINGKDYYFYFEGNNRWVIDWTNPDEPSAMKTSVPKVVYGDVIKFVYDDKVPPMAGEGKHD